MVVDVFVSAVGDEEVSVVCTPPRVAEGSEETDAPELDG